MTAIQKLLAAEDFSYVQVWAEEGGFLVTLWITEPDEDGAGHKVCEMKGESIEDALVKLDRKLRYTMDRAAASAFWANVYEDKELPGKIKEAKA